MKPGVNDPMFERAPFYEVWYTTLNDPATGNAFWIRLTLLAPRGDGRATAALWFMSFEPRLALKKTFDLTEMVRSPQHITLPCAELDRSGLRGSIEDVKFDLAFTSRAPAMFPVPSWVNSVGLAKSTVIFAHPSLSIDGTIDVGGEHFELHSAPGQQAHTFGSRYAQHWVWAHCNSFEGRGDDAIVEAFCAKSRSGVPELTLILVRVRGRVVARNAILGGFLRNKSVFEPGRWLAIAPDVRLLVHAPQEQFIGVTYTNPIGGTLPCYNTIRASCELKVHGEVFRSKGTTHFEFAGRPFPGYAIDLS